MGWFGSIHVRMQSVEHVVAALRVLKQYECYVGNSGADWVGVYCRVKATAGVLLWRMTRGAARKPIYKDVFGKPRST